MIYTECLLFCDIFSVQVPAESGDKNRFWYSRRAKASLVGDSHGLNSPLTSAFCSGFLASRWDGAELVMVPYPATAWCDCLPPSHPR